MEGRALAEAGPDEPGVHEKRHVIKNVGEMNLMTSLNDKPLRLIPSDTTYMEAGDTAVDIILCNVDKYYRNASSYAEGRMKYYVGINGGNTCAHYEIITTTTSPLDLPCISLISPLHLPHISPMARCAHYEIITTTFTTSCSEAQALTPTPNP